VRLGVCADGGAVQWRPCFVVVEVVAVVSAVALVAFGVICSETLRNYIS